MKNIWDVYAPIYERAMRSDKVIYDFICERLLTIISGKEVLEIACGPGTVAKRTAYAAKSMTATDFSEGMIAEAKKGTYPASLTFETADATALPYSNDSFDAVLISNALHIMPEPEKALSEADRVLRSGGILIAPNFVGHSSGIVSRLWSGILTLCGIRFAHQWSPSGYTDFLASKGWDIIFSHKINARIPLMYVECKKGQEKRVEK